MDEQVRVRVDRDSVAAGDDVVSHARVVDLPAGQPLGVVLAAVRPEVRAPGWSWVVRVDGEVAGVWSTDHGVRLLVPDRPVGPGELDVHFSYFLQVDPSWLFDRLAAGARARRRDLVEEYTPIAAARHEEELRRRERELPERLLGPECVAALAAFGAVVDLHADRACWFECGGERWRVVRADTMAQVFAPGRAGATLSARPVKVVEGWLVAALGARGRVGQGLAPYPEHEPVPLPGLALQAGRWVMTGAVTVQVQDGWAVEALRFAHGRTVPDIRAALVVPGA
ncbi:hypothetical protein [Nocardioides sp. J54]|uniref:hypothetical protein n=1 Tax=Nocardioides sp. J54 TaxID=935866 RepID=UPI00048D4747|nr:hypothetical protein [Nocardioides sp. J54]